MTTRTIAGALTLVLSLAVAAPMTAQAERQVPDSLTEIELSFAPVVRKAAPAVVNIYSRDLDEAGSDDQSGTTAQLPSSGEMAPGDAPEDLSALDGSPNSLGSGVIVDPNGTIVTNWHVVRHVGQITVVLADRREFAAQLVREDERADLAILRIPHQDSPFPYLEMRDSDDLEVGDLVLAIGNPFGVGQTVTNGIVSALSRSVSGISDYRTYIQTDAAINPGNSGGALVDLHGRLVGINTALYTEGNGSVGIGFAIPTELVRSVLADSSNGSSIVRPWLGLEGGSVGDETARAAGLPRPEGVIVTAISPNSPIGAAGIKRGDILLAVGDKPVESDDDLRYRFATMPVGGFARLEVWRGRRMMEATVRLMAPPEVPLRNVTLLPEGGKLADITLANLSPALADELRIDSESGIIVLDVGHHGGGGLMVGDIIRAAEGGDVATIDDLQRVIAADTGPLHLKIARKRRAVSLVLN